MVRKKSKKVSKTQAPLKSTTQRVRETVAQQKAKKSRRGLGGG